MTSSMPTAAVDSSAAQHAAAFGSPCSATEPDYQRLDRFKMPPGFRGRHALIVQLWWLVQATLFRLSPQVLYPFRAALLRLFGAKVGQKVVIRPSVTITYPWKVSIGDFAWIGDDAVLYSLGPIDIGDHAVVSQRSYLCAGSHDYEDLSFPISGPAIRIGAQAWLGADTFVGPGNTIGRGTVVGARSSVFSNLPAGMVCLGSPCRPIKPRPRPSVDPLPPASL